MYASKLAKPCYFEFVGGKKPLCADDAVKSEK